MEKIKGYKTSKAAINRQIYLSLILIGVGILMNLTIGYGGIVILVGIISLISAMIFKKREVVRVFDTHFEIKPAPNLPRTVIPWNDLEKVDKESEKKVFIFYKKNNAIKKYRLPVHLLTPEDAADLLQIIESKVQA